MENNGVLIHRNSRLIRMTIVNGRVEYELEYTDNTRQIFNVEKALVSVGRVPNLEDLWDDKVGINTSKRGIENNDTQTQRVEYIRDWGPDRGYITGQRR